MGSLGGNLSHNDAGSLTNRLRALPGFQDALAGRINVGQFPTGPDGLVTPNFREANARYFAEKNGINLGSGSHIDKNGTVHAVNDQAWYADPRWIGPIAVGAATAGLGAFGGGGSAAATLPSTQIGNGFIPAIEGGTGIAGLDTAAGASAAAGAGGAASVLPSTPITYGNGPLPAVGNGPSGSWMPSYSESLPTGSTPSSGMSGGPGGPSGVSRALSSGATDYALRGAGTLLSSYFGNKAANNRARQQTAERESELDPFRQQMDQAGDVASLDRLERASYTPHRYTMSPRGAAPQIESTGGYDYTKSPELVAAAAALKNDVLSGHTAPTMTDPKNFGKTAVLNLLAQRARRRNPMPQTSPYGNADDLSPSYYG
jgi:hypothetical protein